MRRKWTFSKLLLLLESAVVLYTTYEGFALARLAVGYGYLGTLPWVAATVSAAWGPTAHRRAFITTRQRRRTPRRHRV